MTTRDNFSDQLIEQALESQVLTADANGDTIDTQGYDSVTFAVAVGESGDTLSGSVYLELEVESAPDDGTGSPGTWADVADADLIGTTVTGTNTGTIAKIDDAAEDVVAHSIGYRGVDRFVRLVANLTGTHTNGISVVAVALKSHPHHTPVSA